ncbi:MAG TPA: glycosyltransferase family 4 protein [Phototrophicaceae bacterium]|nr:glycosyltransferase family 4 protein [Phototrophicaceae bacterium]
MVKIGVICGIFYPDTGGPATYLYHLLPELIQRGHEIRVVTYGEDDGHDFGYPVTKITRHQRFPMRIWQLTRAIQQLTTWADILYINGYVLPLPLIRPFYHRRIITKIVGDLSWEYATRSQLTTLDELAFQTATLSPRMSLLRSLYRWAVGLSDDIITPGEHLGGIVRGWGIPSERVHVIYNGIPASNLYEVDRRALRRELNLPLDVPLLITIARLTPRKGVHIALKALHLLPENVQMIVVGEGDQLPELESIAPPGRVHFVGRQPHDLTLRYLRAADVFVLSSFTEGLAHVLLEALQVGTPIVATRVGGNPEVATDGITGLLVPPDDPPALAEAIQHLLTDPSFSTKLTAAGRIRSADFRWETTVNQTEALLTKHTPYKP